MEGHLGRNLMRLIAAILLAIPCITNTAPAGEHPSREGRAPRQIVQSSAAGYCEQHADQTHEWIENVEWNVGGAELTLTVDVRLADDRCTLIEDERVCWQDGDSREHLKVWVDWNQDGTFEGGEEDGECGPEGNECVAALSRQVSEDPIRLLTFEHTIDIPQGHVGNRQMRVSLGFDRSPDSPCGSLGWGDVSDRTVEVGGMGEIFAEKELRGDSVTVRGTLTGSAGMWNGVGVTVNGVLAWVHDNEFVANVPLGKGYNKMTVVATDMNGNTADKCHWSSFFGRTLDDRIWLTANAESGLLPFETVLELRGTFEFPDDPVLTCTGPEEVRPEPTGGEPGLRRYRVRMGTEGIHLLTATSQDSGDHTYTDAMAIAVMDRANLDALLGGRWHEMRSALRGNDIDRSLSYFISERKAAYDEAFRLLPEEHMGEIIPGIDRIRFLEYSHARARYVIDADVVVNGEAMTVSSYLIFERDTDGLWKIRFF